MSRLNKRAAATLGINSTITPQPPFPHSPELAPNQLPVKVLKADGTSRRGLLVHQARTQEAVQQAPAAKGG
jgi:hypothetical protein